MAAEKDRQLLGFSARVTGASAVSSIFRWPDKMSWKRLGGTARAYGVCSLARLSTSSIRDTCSRASLFPIVGVVICLLETGYPFFIWDNKTRSIWLICICGMHIPDRTSDGNVAFFTV